MTIVCVVHSKRRARQRGCIDLKCRGWWKRVGQIVCNLYAVERLIPEVLHHKGETGNKAGRIDALRDACAFGKTYDLWIAFSTVRDGRWQVSVPWSRYGRLQPSDIYLMMVRSGPGLYSWGI